MKFLVFGSSGFVGKALILFLKEQNHEVQGVSRTGKGDINLDITNYEAFNKIDFIPDVLINCASRIPKAGVAPTDPDFIEELFKTNVLGAVNICNWAVKNKIEKVINCSTLVVVSKPWPIPLYETYSKLPIGPHTGYAMSKLSQEQLMNEAIRNTQTHISHLRLSAVYGNEMPSSGILFWLLGKLQNNERVTLINGNNVSFDFINVKDVCRIIEILSKNKKVKNIINVASGEEVTLMQLAEILKDIVKSNSTIENSQTETQLNRAVVSNFILNDEIGDMLFRFIPLKKGLQNLIKAQNI